MAGLFIKIAISGINVIDSSNGNDFIWNSYNGHHSRNACSQISDLGSISRLVYSLSSDHRLYLSHYSAIMMNVIFLLLQFSDTLLYTTPVSGGYKLNSAIPLAGMRVRVQ